LKEAIEGEASDPTGVRAQMYRVSPNHVINAVIDPTINLMTVVFGMVMTKHRNS
jgi:hypothetical protein